MAVVYLAYVCFVAGRQETVEGWGRGGATHSDRRRRSRSRSRSGQQDRDRRSPQRHRPQRSVPPSRLIVEHRVALFGNSRVGPRAFPLGGFDDLLQTTFGRYSVRVKFIEGYVQGGLGGECDDNWSAILAAAVRLRNDGSWPAYAVFGLGGPALLPKPDAEVRRHRLQDGRAPSPVVPYENAAANAAKVISGMETAVRALQLHLPGLVPIVESVVPLQDTSGPGLAVCRKARSRHERRTAGPCSSTWRRFCAATWLVAAHGLLQVLAAATNSLPEVPPSLPRGRNRWSRTASTSSRQPPKSGPPWPRRSRPRPRWRLRQLSWQTSSCCLTPRSSPGK